METNPQAPQFVPPGHFYSPIPDIGEIKKREREIFAFAKEIPGIDLREPEQLRLLESFFPYYRELPFEAAKKGGLRYYFDNPAYSYSDAIFLHCMLRHARPKKLIEVGSGYSSCATLDTNELHFDNQIQCTFIEPYPELLRSLVKDEDLSRIVILQAPLQEVPLTLFQELGPGDVLFIDSTHVSKAGSDVNHIFFKILPSLAEGVFIHFHDVFFPFEYPASWIYEGRTWTEDYLLKAFLQFNDSFEIVLFNTFLQRFHRDFIEKNMPDCYKNGGGSIWLRRKAQK